MKHKKWISVSIILASITGIIIWLPEPSERTGSSELSTTNQKTVADSSAPSKNRIVWLKNATYFDGDDWHQNKNLLMENGRVVEYSQNKANDAAKVYDASEYTIIPGLIDAHSHTWGSALTQSAKFGVTTTLDMFTSGQFVKQHQQTRDGYANTQQADLYSAITLVTAPDGHGTEYGLEIPTINSPEQAEQFVQDRVNDGSDYIKVVYDVHQRRFPSIDLATLRAVIQAAHSQNKLAVVHTDNYQSALEASQAGADGLVHGFFDQAVDDQLITSLKNNNTFVVPTTTVMASILGTINNDNLIADFEAAGVDVTQAKIGLKDKFSARVQQQKHDMANANIKALFDSGIVILAGTDAPNPGTNHGISMHLELELLVQAGLSETQAIKSATYAAANAFKLKSRGCLKVNCRADLVFLQQDPREDIRNTRSIKKVFKNGFEINQKKVVAKTALQLPTILGDFSKDQPSDLGFPWSVTTDSMMKGNSTATIAIEENQLKVAGTIGSVFSFPWSGVYLPLTSNQSQTVALPEGAAISFKMKGTEGNYRLMIFSTLSAMRPLTLNFNVNQNSQQYQLDLAQFDQALLNAVTGIAIVASSDQKSFEFYLDDVKLVSHSENDDVKE